MMDVLGACQAAGAGIARRAAEPIILEGDFGGAARLLARPRRRDSLKAALARERRAGRPGWGPARVNAALGLGGRGAGDVAWWGRGVGLRVEGIQPTTGRQAGSKGFNQ